MQRWERDRGLEEPRGDLRPVRIQTPANQQSEAERARLLVVVNSAEFAAMPPSQIVPRLADRGEYIGSESTFYRTMRASHQLAHRGNPCNEHSPISKQAGGRFKTNVARQ